jgi:hypothetical protein
MKVRIIFLLFILVIGGCQSRDSKDLNDDQLRELAWNVLEESERSTIVGSKDDIEYKDDHNSGVVTIINNAPEDVWKSAQIVYLNENQVKGISNKLKVKNSKEIVEVNFRTLLGETSNVDYEPIKVYIDLDKGNVIGKEKGKLNIQMQF